MSENNVEQNWSLNINVAGVQARQGVGGGYVEPVTGAYRVKITEAVLYKKDDGKSSVRFQTVFADGEFAGAEQRLYIGTDTTKTGNLRSWKTALLSAGYTSAQVETGAVDISGENFVGREAFVYYKAKDANDPTSQPDRQFITPEAFASFNGEASTTAQAAKAQKVGQLGGASATTAAPAAASVPAPKGSGALRAMLGK